jgi:predicted TIM-barrel fold metal-dependent hydrolase
MAFAAGALRVTIAATQPTFDAEEAVQELDRLSRRDILRGSVAAAGGLALGDALAAEPAEQAKGAIDAHVHVWTPDVERYPLAKGYSKADMQPPSFTPEELLAEARPVGVTRVVLIQMSFYGFDNRYMLDTMRRFPGVFAGVAVIDEHAADVRGTMRALKGQGVRGFRIHPATQPVEPWLSSPGMQAMWRTGAAEGLAMCALINPEALVPLDKMCERFPETPVVVDHFGRVGVDGQVRDVDVTNLCRLARHKNTHVKVSAYYALGAKKAPYTDLGPMIRRLVDAYSPKRLMWATDCPYQVQNGHTYRDSIELVRSRLDFLSADDRQWLLGKTAQRVFFS